MRPEAAEEASVLRCEDPLDGPRPDDWDRLGADGQPVTDTFTLLSDDKRVATVRALADSEGPLRFSELRSRVGVRDGGLFNYHLQKLRGRLVEKTDEGYVLTDEGERAAALL